jgi:hypothetical protein
MIQKSRAILLYLLLAATLLYPILSLNAQQNSQSLALLRLVKEARHTIQTNASTPELSNAIKEINLYLTSVSSPLCLTVPEGLFARRLQKLNRRFQRLSFVGSTTLSEAKVRQTKLKVAASLEAIRRSLCQPLGVRQFRDTDAAPDEVTENSPMGTYLGITLQAKDPNDEDTITYSLADPSYKVVAIDAKTGICQLAAPINYEHAQELQFKVVATSSDGSKNFKDITVAILDMQEPLNTINDSNAADNLVNENAPVGTTVGIVIAADDEDRDDSVRYSLDEDATFNFTIDANSGIVTTRKSFDFESTPRLSGEAVATSSDGSQLRLPFSVSVVNQQEPITDLQDIDLGANIVVENASTGTTIAVQLAASDPDTEDSVSYHLADPMENRVSVHPTIGLITVSGSIDFEDSEVFSIPFEARSTDGSKSTLSLDFSVIDLPAPSLSLTFPPLFGDIGNSIRARGTASGIGTSLLATASVGNTQTSASVSLQGTWNGLNVTQVPGLKSSPVNFRSFSEGEPSVSAIGSYDTRAVVSPRWVYEDATRNTINVFSSTQHWTVDNTTGDFTLVRALAGGNGAPITNIRDISIGQDTSCYYLLDQTNGLLCLDPVTGSRSVVSGTTVGTGPSIANPRLLAVATQVNKAYVVTAPDLETETFSNVIEVNLTTGDRILVSDGTIDGDVGYGLDLVTGVEVAVPLDALFLSSEGAEDTVFKLDLHTGIVSELSGDGQSQTVGSGPDFGGPVDLTYSATNNKILVASTERPGIYSVDPISGNRVAVATNATGTGENLNPIKISLDSSGQALISDSNRLSVFKVNTSNGNRVEIASRHIGIGELPRFPKRIFFSSSAEDLFTLESHRVIRIVKNTGDRTILSDETHGIGTVLANIVSGLLDAANNRLLVTHNFPDGIYSIDVTTGNRLEVSGSGRGTGPAITATSGIALNPTSGLLTVLDSNNKLYSVDPANGNRTLLNGTGPSVSGFNELVFDSLNQRVLGVNSSATVVVAINPNTGARTTISSSTVGSGPTFSSHSGLAVSSTNGTIFLNAGSGGLIKIDPQNGNRTVVSSSSVGQGATSRNCTGLDLISDTLAIVACAQFTQIIDLTNGDRAVISR